MLSTTAPSARWPLLSSIRWTIASGIGGANRIGGASRIFVSHQIIDDTNIIAPIYMIGNMLPSIRLGSSWFWHSEVCIRAIHWLHIGTEHTLKLKRSPSCLRFESS